MNDLPDLTIQVVGDSKAIKDFVAFLENAGVHWQNARGYYPTARLENRFVGKVAYLIEYASLPLVMPVPNPQPRPGDVVLGGNK